MPEENRDSPVSRQPSPSGVAATPVPAEREAHTPYTPGRGEAPGLVEDPQRVDVALDQPGQAQVDAGHLGERVGHLREGADPDVVVLLGQPAYGVAHLVHGAATASAPSVGQAHPVTS